MQLDHINSQARHSSKWHGKDPPLLNGTALQAYTRVKKKPAPPVTVSGDDVARDRGIGAADAGERGRAESGLLMLLMLMIDPKLVLVLLIVVYGKELR